MRCCVELLCVFDLLFVCAFVCMLVCVRVFDRVCMLLNLFVTVCACCVVWLLLYRLVVVLYCSVVSERCVVVLW